LTALSNTVIARDYAAVTAPSAAVATGGLKSLKRSYKPNTAGIVLCNVRDEIALLPHFLKHYRKIGVTRFAFVDNGSVDGTLPYLLDQPDCDVYQHLGNFRNAFCGMQWTNQLLREYQTADWFLAIDADELAVYDGWPDLDLPTFAREMGRAGRSAVTAIMVDMYGPGPVAETFVPAEADLLAASPLFDGEGYRIERPRDWREESFPRLDITGGPGPRLFGTHATRGWLGKVPLLLEPNIAYRDPHSVFPTALNLAPPRIASLHFRFTAAMVEKLPRVLRRKVHAEGSLSEYDAIRQRIQDDPSFTLANDSSVRFTSPQQFIQRGMISARNEPD
jgi:hypothetical protein